jgi:predicted dehydrogenase
VYTAGTTREALGKKGFSMGESDLKVSSGQNTDEVDAPDLPYLPAKPAVDDHTIGLIGCGGITAYHLDAYRDAGFRVDAFCDVNEEAARARRDAYTPEGSVHTDYHELLALPHLNVVDIATHPEIRGEMIEASLLAGMHVLSQKPYTLDLDEGARLADLADSCGLKLAVNQNGRWAPHFSYMRHAVAAGLIGEVQAVHLGVHWDHTWTKDTVFNEVPHLILYDFAIHWFDMLCCFMGRQQPQRVYASEAHTSSQDNKPPMLGQILVEYEHAQASLAFDAATLHGTADCSHVIGAKGTIASSGPDLSHQSVTLSTERGIARPALEGEWFKNGFEGTMAELLSAIDDDREPDNNARCNLDSLALCFAAIKSAETHEPQIPGTVQRLP